MESKAKRTLVKSAPELWELADDPARMGQWTAGLVGGAHPIAVEVTERRPQRSIAWRTLADSPRDARVELELAANGLGTSVSIKAEHPRLDGAEAALERLLDDLGSAARRPFARG
jgi:hypothetical protein